jgi:hypothetical protein
MQISARCLPSANNKLAVKLLANLYHGGGYKKDNEIISTLNSLSLEDEGLAGV